MRRIRQQLTFANVASAIALFVAISGGTAVALSGSNTVFSDDIVDNQVYSPDVRNDNLAGGGLAAADLRAGSVGTSEAANNSLTGTDINEATLNLAPGAVHLVGAAGEPQFQNGCTNKGSGGAASPQPVGFYKDREGVVRLQGRYTCPSAAVVFNLPAGYRPANGQAVEEIARCTTGCGSPAGAVLMLGAGVTGYPAGAVVGVGTDMSLDGITFRAFG